MKANSDPAIIETFYKAGASFDVASMAEFRSVYDNIKSLPAKERQDFIWDKIIYANPIKDTKTLVELDPYKPLVTYDNRAEIDKAEAIRAARRFDLADSRAEHRGRRRVVVEVRRIVGRGGRSDRSRVSSGVDGRGAQLPRRQPVHEFRELRSGVESGGWDFSGSPRPRASASENPRHRRRLSDRLRPACQAVRPVGATVEFASSTDCFHRGWKSWPSRADFSWPQPLRRSPR